MLATSINLKEKYTISFSSHKAIRFIYLGVYKNSNLTIHNMIIDFNGFRVPIGKNSINGIVFKEVYNISKINPRAQKCVKYLDRRDLFSYVYTVPLKDDIIVVHEPYTTAWKTDCGVLIPGIFNSYIIVVPRHLKGTCEIRYIGFLYVDIYYIILTFTFVILALTLLVNTQRRYEQNR